MPTLRWCPSCNVPLIGRVCDRCGSPGVKVELPPPADARPALPWELRALREALVNETGRDCLGRLVGGQLVVTSRTRYIDYMAIVLVRAARLGKLHYDPLERRWRFRFSRFGAELALEHGLLESVTVRGERLREGMRLRAPSSAREGEQLVLTNGRGEPVGVAYVRGGRLHVRDVFAEPPPPEVESKAASLEDAVRANQSELRRRMAKALIVIDKFASRFRGRSILVAFSGGKDSGTVLDLVMEAGVEARALLNDTGAELPENLRHAHEVCEDYGIELLVTSAGDALWRGVRRLGPPAVDYRWCTQALKLAPTIRLLKGFGEALVFEGRRASESAARSRGSMVRRGMPPTALFVSPIFEWDQMTEWLYIAWRKLPVNPLYAEIYDRIGCFMCPNCTLPEFEYVERRHPELWARWLAELERWRERLGLPECWVSIGLWRWLGPTTASLNLAQHVKAATPHWRDVFKGVGALIACIKRGEHEIEVKLGERIDPARACRLAAAEGWRIVRPGLIRRGDEVAEIKHDTIKVRAPDPKGSVISVLRAVARAALCVGCGGCVAVCPEGAALEGPDIDIERCNGCRLCEKVCPVAETFVGRVLASLIENNARTFVKVEVKLEAPAVTRATAEGAAEIPWRVLEGSGEV